MLIDLGNFTNLITLIVGVVAFAIIAVVVFLNVKNKIFTILIGLLELSSVASFLFHLDYLAFLFLVLICCTLISVTFLNIKDFKEFFNKFALTNDNFTKKEKINGEKLYDRERIFKEVEKAVVTCSKRRIGALITFERKDSLEELTKNGTIINAPICSELLEAIFYPGARLHDGAVIIRSDKIIAASVYYTPTTKAMSGKYGSRHRAAIGVSEINDSLTVVVSEETGRISFAEEGSLETVTPSKFLLKLTEKLDKLNG